MKRLKLSKGKKAAIIVVGILAVLIAVCAIYVSDYYHADLNAIADMEFASEAVVDTEIIIEGGCHAYFGVYGMQDGDGIPTISNKEQIKITAQQIAQWAAVQ